MRTPLTAWIGFNAFVLVMLALDLGVFHRKSHKVSLKEAVAWTLVWVTLALIFNAGMWHLKGSEAGLQFLAGYLIEKSLSVDNIFVFLTIFAYFQVPEQCQHKVLFWGILGALVMRGIFIAAGVTLIHRFHWMIYVFGAFLVITGVKMALAHGKTIDPGANPLLRLFRKVVPVTPTYHEDHFTARLDGHRYATPLLVALIFIEITDVIFAVDSIPAILAITDDPFIVYTSNVFAILGLRSLFFALAGFVAMFRFLSYGLAAILVFVGFKMLAIDYCKIPIAVSLSVLAGILAVSVAASITADRWKKGDQ